MFASSFSLETVVDQLIGFLGNSSLKIGGSASSGLIDSAFVPTFCMPAGSGVATPSSSARLGGFHMKSSDALVAFI